MIRPDSGGMAMAVGCLDCGMHGPQGKDSDSVIQAWEKLPREIPAENNPRDPVRGR